jgi:peptidoglycan/xylan/chitin deacetylase (PgdA/CDA1 family)
VTIGVEELARRAVPATFFVVPTFVGGGPFWWDALASGERLGLDRNLRERAISDWGGRDGDVRRWAEAGGLRRGPVPECALAASEEELHAATRNPGITLASHSWSHPNLVRLAPAELREELGWSLRWLQERHTSVIPWLSYPYGLASRSAEVAAAAAGYTAALALGGGCFTPGRGNRYGLPRLNVPAELSANGFVLWTSGLFGSSPAYDGALP